MLRMKDAEGKSVELIQKYCFMNFLFPQYFSDISVLFQGDLRNEYDQKNRQHRKPSKTIT
mgnify:CR=1 FL=1